MFYTILLKAKSIHSASEKIVGFSLNSINNFKWKKKMFLCNMFRGIDEQLVNDSCNTQYISTEIFRR